ncbi:hypothetical protein OFY17_08285 [Marinomonas sp. C2222]|uniref:Uncharacterized protein n=1 Tax=Marinomonas sargassi TaxID=2984494 RepID=A0ABT2YSZ1_9GAMM|nr:hypothetical protein [Marinomonas sargassi]MCV2402875.1 hypothetical protein [Marinomonas sargassi]
MSISNINYDYTLFPKMEQGYLVIPKPCDGLKPHIELYDRFCSAIFMASMISEKAKKYMIRDAAQQCAYVRATLAEFCSIEECIKQLHPQLDKKLYLIHCSENPAFHMIKLLRNYNIHLSNSTLSKKSIRVAPLNKPESECDMSVLYIDNLDYSAISKLNSAKKYYSMEDLESFIRLFDDKQHAFGLSDLLIATIVQYSELISKTLNK